MTKHARQVVVITGASGGIGAALARRLGTEGHQLVLAARRTAALRAVAAEATARGAADALVVPTDVTRRGDVEALRDAAISAFGHVDVWVNNAGRGIARPVLALTDEDVDEIIAINLKSALYGMQAVVPHFVARGRGLVVNVSSVLGKVPLASVRSVYSAAKAALNSLTANVRMDLRERAPGVRVALVLPGIVTTDFARNVRGGRPGAPPPLPTWAPTAQSPDEVADVIAGVLRQPRAEVYTNPAQHEMARQYVDDVERFEERMTPPDADARGRP